MTPAAAHGRYGATTPRQRFGRMLASPPRLFGSQTSMEPEDSRHRVVVVGAGFAGLRVAWGLRHAEADVVVVDRQNHHLFQPLLYQVATAGLASPDIAEPIRRVLRRCPNARVLYGAVDRIDPTSKTVWMGTEGLPYDTVVLAAGATHSYFGNDAWAKHAPGLKTPEDAHDIRGRILKAFEAAERIESDAHRRAWLRFVVVGAGPTGVELAGAIAELARKILPRDYRRFDARSAEVFLIEGTDRVLGSYPRELSASARTQLEKLGVHVRTNALVTGIDDTGVSVDGEQRIEAKTVIWAAGVQASPLVAQLNVPVDRAGRARVADDLSVPDHPEVFVIGDAAHVEQGGQTVPGTAPAAIQMGQHVARCIRSRLKGQRSLPFLFRDKGSMATIGRAAAVADFGRVHLRGLPAWLAWLVVHLLFLIGWRSRLVVVINWMWAYLVYRPAARILPDLARNEPPSSRPPTEGTPP